MRCPFCSADDTQVIDSRVNDEGDTIRRRRRCAACEKRFTTYETAELHMPQVVKQNGTREEFSPDKLRLSFTRALHKRPVSMELVDRSVDDIMQKVLGRGEREVQSRELGEAVMRALRRLDKVAYIRFASIYRSFQDVDDFHDVIRDLDTPKRGKK
ncbi:MAG: transcriptional regulator NrdR [Methylobacillus sp.]|jgi:transcriptional repressor NrdR|nr:transcriptional regulator NrdR [Methylobacillus sp.]